MGGTEALSLAAAQACEPGFYHGLMSVIVSFSGGNDLSVYMVAANNAYHGLYGSENATWAVWAATTGSEFILWPLWSSQGPYIVLTIMLSKKSRSSNPAVSGGRPQRRLETNRCAHTQP